MESNQNIRLDVALLHYPVVNRLGETIGSAVTNLDVHDIARAARTYGVGNYWLVTPFAEQRALTGEIIAHWTEGHGKRSNPDRGEALSLIRICSDLDEVLAGMREKWGEQPTILATSAARRDDTVDYPVMRRRVAAGEPVLLLFGTAWGLTAEMLQRADATLPPIHGAGDYNHLSVRSAVAIILDRLLS